MSQREVILILGALVIVAAGLIATMYRVSNLNTKPDEARIYINDEPVETTTTTEPKAWV